MQKDTLELNENEMTKEMKYIKWPSKAKALTEAVSIIVGVCMLMILIAAGDEVGGLLMHCLTKLSR